MKCTLVKDTAKLGTDIDIGSCLLMMYLLALTNGLTRRSCGLALQPSMGLVLQPRTPPRGGKAELPTKQTKHMMLGD
jgi:hypothetical protein